jgi:hypothetical protein
VNASWRVVTNATTEPKARLVYRRLLKRAEQPNVLQSVRRYGYLPLSGQRRDGFEILFSIPLAGDVWSDHIVQTLGIAQRIGHGWTVVGDVYVQFSGFTSNVSVAGVISAEFMVENPSEQT